jgi:3-methyladenine DNA glycosylase AlkC
MCDFRVLKKRSGKLVFFVCKISILSKKCSRRRMPEKKRLQNLKENSLDSPKNRITRRTKQILSFYCCSLFSVHPA